MVSAVQRVELAADSVHTRSRAPEHNTGSCCRNVLGRHNDKISAAAAATAAASSVAIVISEAVPRTLGPRRAHDGCTHVRPLAICVLLGRATRVARGRHAAARGIEEGRDTQCCIRTGAARCRVRDASCGCRVLAQGDTLTVRVTLLRRKGRGERCDDRRPVRRTRAIVWSQRYGRQRWRTRARRRRCTCSIEGVDVELRERDGRDGRRRRRQLRVRRCGKESCPHDAAHPGGCKHVVGR